MLTLQERCYGVFRQVKARKAKYGFTHGVGMNVEKLIALGFILGEVQRCYPKLMRIETSNGAGVVTVNLYTDEPSVATWFCANFIDGNQTAQGLIP